MARPFTGVITVSSDSKYPRADLRTRPRRIGWWIGTTVAWLLAVLVLFFFIGLRWALVHEYGIETTRLWPEVGRVADLSIPGMVLITLAAWLTLRGIGHARWTLAVVPVAAAVVVSIGVWGDYHAYAQRQADPAFRQPTTGSLTAQLVVGGTRQSWGTPLTRGTVTFTGPTTVQVTVDSQGQARADNLLPGTYQLTATSPDYKHGKATCTAARSVKVEVLAWQLIPVFCPTK